MVLSLRGSVCLYQGEELGLPEAEVPFERIQDPYGKVLWPEFKGRDGCRTPMPWTQGEQGGFSSVEPWLPVEERHLPLAVANQQDDADSVLNATRAMLAFRRQHPALIEGEIRLLEVGEDLLGFIRESNADQGGERLLCVFNLTGEPRETPLPASVGGHAKLLEGPGFQASLAASQLVLPAYQAAFISLD